MSLRVFLLVITMTVLTIEEELTTNDVTSADELANIKDLLDGAFSGSGEELKEDFQKALEECYTLIGEPAHVSVIETLPGLDLRGEAVFVEQYVVGCIMKKIFLGDQYGDDVTGRRRFRFYANCVGRQNVLAKGHLVKLGKRLMASKVCGHFE